MLDILSFKTRQLISQVKTYNMHTTENDRWTKFPLLKGNILSIPYTNILLKVRAAYLSDRLQHLARIYINIYILYFGKRNRTSITCLGI